MATDTMQRTPGTREGPRRTATGRPVSSPRHTRPAAPPPRSPKAPGREERPEQRTRPADLRGPGRQQRMPFILLLVGLLGGALVSLLVISTTLDEGSYRITNLTNSNSALTKHIQVLTQQVADGQDPGTIEREAYQQGMRQDKNLRFVNTKTGKISSSAPVSP
jgi:hypothetical protein